MKKIDAERHLMVQICNETPNLSCFVSNSSNIVHKITETAKKTQDMGWNNEKWKKSMQKDI